MDGVRTAEFASPYELLQNKSGIFYDMVQTLGVHECERLTKIAAAKFKSEWNPFFISIVSEYLM